LNQLKMIGTNNNQPHVIVIGAGISGIHAAFELAEAGCRVLLIDKAPAVGGILTQLDHQFPSDHCGMCRMLPMIQRDESGQFCLRKGLIHENIDILTSTTVNAVEGNPGALSVSVTRFKTGVNQRLCTECGQCETVCPVEVPDQFNESLSSRKAIYKPIPHQFTTKRIIDFNVCTQCGECEKTCPTQAINLSADAISETVENISGVIYTPGTDLFDPSSVDVYGFGFQPNVVTAAGFERILNSCGPFKGKPVRPSDRQPVKKIAWLQCVGSRNIMLGADHCSTACCMFAVKEAVLAHRKLGSDIETTIFYMDMRTFGRDFQRYKDRAEKEFNVRFVRCRVHSVEPSDNPGDLAISYVDTNGKLIEEIFDIAVLSTGQKPGAALPDFTGHEGVEVIDAPHRLKDISESVIQSGICAGNVLKNIISQNNTTLADETDDPDQSPRTKREKNLFSQKPEFHVALLNRKTPDKKSDEGSFDWNKLSDNILKLETSISVSTADVSTGDDLENFLIKTIQDKKINRLIVAGSRANTFYKEINRAIKKAGLISSVIEIVDLAPLLSQPEDAVCAIESAVNRLRVRSAITGSGAPVEKTALIVGGGPAGLSAAKTLADMGINVTLVEKENQLGGNGNRIFNEDTSQSINTLISEVANNPLVSVRMNSSVIWSRGNSGRFVSRIRDNTNKEKIIVHGATVLATGGQPARTEAYHLGGHEKIITQFDLEKQIHQPEFDASGIKSLVMVQCAGSREEPNNFCSRICCIKALNNAIAIKEKNPDTDIRIFYRDIMTCGDNEKIYTEARRKGILFIPFDTDKKPVVSLEENNLTISADDPVLGKAVTLHPERLVLSTGVMPNPTEELSSVFNIDLTVDGFTREADYKWRPVDASKQGIFIAGLGRAPQTAQEAINEGKAAAYRAFRILNRKILLPQRISASVRHAICSKCELCIETCPYDARYIDSEQNKIMVDIAACQGCGACAAICPNSATLLGDFEDHGVMDALEAALL
jgi:heterodisulfide reductase subunit A